VADPAEQRLAALRKRWEEDRSSGAFVPLAEEYRRLGRLSEAITVLEQGMKVAPNYLSARIALGRCRLDLGDAAGACTILEQVLHQDPTQLVASKLLVEAYLRSQRPEQARERLNLYAVLNDRDPELDELRRRVQQGIREREVSRAVDAAPAPERRVLAPEPSPSMEPSPEATPATPPAAAELPAPSPIAAVAPVAPQAPAPAPFTVPPPLPVPVATQPRATGDVFRLPAVSVPTPDFGRIAALQPSAPVPRGTVFGGLGTPADRRRYVAALIQGGVFGVVGQESTVAEVVEPEPAAAFEERTPTPSAPEEFSWDSVAVEPVAAPNSPLDAAPPLEEAVEAAPAAEEREVIEVTADADAALEAPAPPPAEEIQPTATLGELYLSQGHRQEAQTIFERVLEAQPDHPGAREGLETALRQAAPAVRQGVTARKVAMLQDFLKRVRGGSEHHVP
jgi:tetratricopeptide (TPR) repeat protein